MSDVLMAYAGYRYGFTLALFLPNETWDIHIILATSHSYTCVP